MAKRKSSGTRTRTVTKYVRSRASGKSLKAMTKPLMAGVVTGVVQQLVPNGALGGYGDALVPVATGYIMNDKTLMTIGAYQLGAKLASGFNVSGITTSSQGGGY